MMNRRRSWAPVLLVLVMAPVTAEYLIGYDDTIGDPFALVFGILIFGPLYGAPAVLIHEVSRRRGLGWPTMLLLATAFGLVQAGLIDQSLFNPDYRGIPYWQEMRQPTYLPWFGTSAYMALTFVAGHVFGSIAAPIALAESWFPRRRHESWLGPVGVAVMVALWAAGALVVVKDQFASDSFRISQNQLVGTAVVVVVLVLLALTRQRRQVRREGQVPAPWVVAVVSALLLTVRSLISTTWLPTLCAIGALAVWLVLVGRWHRRTEWNGRHVVGAAAGVLVSIGGPAFFTIPLGDVSESAKLVSNVVLMGLVLAVAARGYIVTARADVSRRAR